MKRQNKIENLETFFFIRIEQYSMTPESFDSKIRGLGFTLQLSHCLALCHWGPNLTSMPCFLISNYG